MHLPLLPGSRQCWPVNGRFRKRFRSRWSIASRWQHKFAAPNASGLDLDFGFDAGFGNGFDQRYCCDLGKGEDDFLDDFALRSGQVDEGFKGLAFAIADRFFPTGAAFVDAFANFLAET